MTSLRDKVENRKIRYHLGKCRILMIKAPSNSTVQREDGKFVNIGEPAVYLQRIGDGKMGFFSDELDPAKENHADYIAVIDDWLEKNKQEAKSRKIWKAGSGRPPEAIRNWDNMDSEQIRNVLDATQGDLEWAMDYELKRPESVVIHGNVVELGGPREDVLEVLEDLYANGFESTVEQSEEAPAL